MDVVPASLSKGLSGPLADEEELLCYFAVTKHGRCGCGKAAQCQGTRCQGRFLPMGRAEVCSVHINRLVSEKRHQSKNALACFSCLIPCHCARRL